MGLKCPGNLFYRIKEEERLQRKYYDCSIGMYGGCLTMTCKRILETHLLQ